MLLQPTAKALHLEISTTVYGASAPVSALSFVPEEILPKPTDMAKNINKISFQNNLIEPRHWVYEDENGFKSILEDFISIIENYGFNRLSELSVEEGIIPTDDVALTLLTSYEELSEKFIKENKLDVSNVSNVSKEVMETWFDVIDKKIKEIKNESYKNVQGILVEISAFLGEQLRREVGGEWSTGFDPRVVFLLKMNVFDNTACAILSNIIGSWKHQDIDWIKESYFLFIDSKLPVTKEFIKSFSSRMIELEKFKYPSLK